MQCLYLLPKLLDLYRQHELELGPGKYQNYQVPQHTQTLEEEIVGIEANYC
jgi:hypothetical protein